VRPKSGAQESGFAGKKVGEHRPLNRNSELSVRFLSNIISFLFAAEQFSCFLC
jgi:hypothetical protein